MPRSGGSKVKIKKQNKGKKRKEYNCEDCLDTGEITKDVRTPCPYCR